MMIWMKKDDVVAMENDKALLLRTGDKVHHILSKY